jgi:hypothetical protein
MSAQPANQTVDDTPLDAVISATIETLLKEHSTHEAALYALARRFVGLLAAADAFTSRGSLRGRFSARPEMLISQ